jgi:hypothetical protein
MHDIDERLASYIDAIAEPITLDEIWDRAAGAPGPRPRRTRVLVAAVVVACAIAAVAVAVIVRDHPAARNTYKPGPTVLPLPAPGRASAEWLTDGTPVFVVNDPVLGISVVSADDPHLSGLVWWCERSRGFEDPIDGDLFDARGRKVAGPAPRGLSRYDVTVLPEKGKVEVKDAETASRIGEQATRPRGESCIGGDLHPLAPVVRHVIPRSGQPAVAPRTARAETSAGIYALVHGVRMVWQREPTLCAAWRNATCTEPVGVDSFGVGELRDASTRVTGLFLVRVREDHFTDLIEVAVERVDGAQPPCGRSVPANGFTYDDIGRAADYDEPMEQVWAFRFSAVLADLDAEGFCVQVGFEIPDRSDSEAVARMNASGKGLRAASSGRLDDIRTRLRNQFPQPVLIDFYDNAGVVDREAR